MKIRREEVAELIAENTKFRVALEELSRLGNGDKLGNSDGNMIAQKALAKLI